ncbi:hypothetical protein KFK09_015310 [Dendrobium nobile]|uniref:Uncharacterized protein n=1 Tax=Dendrobium nobile TaxID=94219 RepID=A0A8T3B5I4_DENNO|nr:hypothetical protein KFK09_015310 [Dendrobium nobile]
MSFPASIISSYFLHYQDFFKDLHNQFTILYKYMVEHSRWQQNCLTEDKEEGISNSKTKGKAIRLMNFKHMESSYKIFKIMPFGSYLAFGGQPRLSRILVISRRFYIEK